MECLVDRDQLHEVIHATVPSHIAREFIPDRVRSGFLIASLSGRMEMAQRILDGLLSDKGGISLASGRRLLDAALSLVGDAIAGCADAIPEKLTITECRVDDILRFVEIHLSNPELNAALVCRGCGISPRYLSTLLHRHGTTFNSLVWDQRMAKAKEWLSSSNAQDVRVSEIAHNLGFKSAAHFSRRFKRMYRLNPSECRAA